MQIAITSGKGGTGKTTVATSLSKSLAGTRNVYYIDCDVEAPNGHLFLKPKIEFQADAVIQIPSIDQAICSVCGRCVEICQFHALAKTPQEILVFPELCHGCGSCTWNCKTNAIQEIENPIGTIESGVTAEGILFSQGILKISSPMPTPIIRQLRKCPTLSEDTIVILDSPPGASCSVVETLRGCDYAILVTESTPFGIHDLYQILGILQDLRICAGVIINRYDGNSVELEQILAEKNIPVLLTIPFDPLIAAGIAAGGTLIDILPDTKQIFLEMVAQIEMSLRVTQ